MKSASNVADKILSIVFRKSAVEKAFIIVYIASWSFGSDYMSIASNAIQNVIQVVLRKIKNCVSCNI